MIPRVGLVGILAEDHCVVPCVQDGRGISFFRVTSDHCYDVTSLYRIKT